MSILPDAETFGRLADGSLRGPVPALARALLAGLALPYAAAVTVRNVLYDRGLLPRLAAPVPVVGVGNLTLGGTGKTPLVAWLVRQLLSQGRRPAIVSRGYAARRGEPSDEAAELAILVPGVPHHAERDRVAATRAAAAEADVVVLDDGFQHRRLRRDLDVVAIDASDPFGCGHLFPRGLLREGLGGLARADAVVLTRAGDLDPAGRDAIRARFDRACGGRAPRIWIETEHRPVGLRDAAGGTLPLSQLARGPVAAFCGIGNPAAFRGTLARLGCEPVAFRAFPDHHAYTAADRESLAAGADAAGAMLAVTTLKDLVRLRATQLGGLPLVALEIALEPLTDPTPLTDLVAQAACRGGGDDAG